MRYQFVVGKTYTLKFEDAPGGAFELENKTFTGKCQYATDTYAVLDAPVTGNKYAALDVVELFWSDRHQRWQDEDCQYWVVAAEEA